MNMHVSDQPLSLTTESLQHLATIRRWAFFLSILGFIGSGFLLVFGLVFAFIFRFMEDLGESGFFASVFIAVLYVGIGVAYFFPAYYLFRFSDRVKHSLAWGDTDAMTHAFRYLKSHYVFIGVAVIAGFVLYILIIVGLVIAGISGGLGDSQYYS